MPPPEISVIVPMYNEAGNVAPLAAEVFAALREERRAIELVLVDDASTDDTWAQIQPAPAEIIVGADLNRPHVTAL